MKFDALRIRAGKAARQHLDRFGLEPEHVRCIPAAAGGPKGLALLPFDRWLFGRKSLLRMNFQLSEKKNAVHTYIQKFGFRTFEVRDQDVFYFN